MMAFVFDAPVLLKTAVRIEFVGCEYKILSILWLVNNLWSKSPVFGQYTFIAFSLYSAAAMQEPLGLNANKFTGFGSLILRVGLPVVRSHTKRSLSQYPAEPLLL